MISGFKKKSTQKGNIIFVKYKKQIIAAAFILFTITTITLIKKNQENKTQPVQQVQNIAQPNNPILDEEEIVATSPDAKNPNLSQETNNIYSQTVNLKENAQNKNVLPSSNDEVEIIVKNPEQSKNYINLQNKHEKIVTVAVEDSGRSDPFLPTQKSSSLQANSLPYLTAPPETLPTNSDASSIMGTTISGILYDKYCPSAIINIGGNDYLVKKGDIINRYKILLIDKTQVVVQLGQNIYKAGVGELLSQTDVNYNTIANLNKKFGGNDIQINVKKKGY